MKPKASASAVKLRCAIYTRVSSDSGLEQEFNSLDNQREAAEAHIRSQQFEGWSLIPTRYDDGGFSGGSMERPALQKLLEDVRAKRIDVIVVYKVDRLTRSLADFAKLVELFDACGVSFVSVTQSFNTTTSMGRLTLNVLLSFAQFEREVTGERIRDKIAASKKKGIWMGGPVPLGYRVENRKLLVVEEEAEQVRTLFRRYCQLRSVPALVEELRAQGFVTRLRTRQDGSTIGGVPLTNGPLAVILRNRVYLGEINHKGESYPGEHEAIIDQALFDEVQAIQSENLNRHHTRSAATRAPLMGKLYDDRGNLMSPSFATKHGIRYRYYTSCALTQRRKTEAGSISRVAAPAIEEAIGTALQAHGLQHRVDDAYSVDRDQQQANPLPPSMIGEARDELIRISVAKAELRKGAIVITPAEDLAEDSETTLTIPWSPPNKTPRRLILSDGGNADVTSLATIRPQVRTRMLVAIVRARHWVDQLTAGKIADIDAIAAAEGVTERYIRLVLPLAFLSPKVVTATIAGRIPASVTVTELGALQAEWQQQETVLPSLERWARWIG